jgi:hypothetical protein
MVLFPISPRGRRSHICARALWCGGAGAVLGSDTSMRRLMIVTSTGLFGDGRASLRGGGVSRWRVFTGCVSGKR